MMSNNWGKTFYDPVRYIMIDFRMCLDLYEREVLFFIFSRTGAYNKVWEFISINQFMNGMMNRDGTRYIAAPVNMAKYKLLDSLKHLEGKGYIEVRHGDIRTKNEYRIKTQQELNIQHIMSYTERYQPTLFKSSFTRLHRNDPALRITNRVQEALAQTSPRSQYEPRVGQPEDQGVGSNSNLLKIQNNKKPLSNVAVPSRTALRHVPFRKIQVGGNPK